MNVHEYQAKNLLRQFGIPVPLGALATTKAEARQAAVDLGGSSFVVKAQIHAGGRGKGGGVKVVKNADEVADAAKQMLG
ncbi:MAG: ATP-grasp domain-containing protein, partial [Pseudomonadota bacterium]